MRRMLWVVLLAVLALPAFLEAGTKPGITFIRGDANADGTVDIADGTFIVNFLFLGRSAPTCDDAADADDSGELDLSDAGAA